MDQKQKGLFDLYLHIIPLVLMLIIGAFSGGQFLYLGLRESFSSEPFSVQFFFLGIGYLMLFGTAVLFYRSGKWFEYCIWVFNYGTVRQGTLTLSRRVPNSFDVLAKLVMLIEGEGRWKYKVRIMRPFLFRYPKRSKEIDVEVMVDPTTNLPIAVESEESFLWILVYSKKKTKSA